MQITVPNISIPFNIPYHMLINPSVSFLAGIAAGYSLEKSGAPYSSTDVEMAVGVPIGISSLEILVDRMKPFNLTCNDLVSSGLIGVNTFIGGDFLGRYLAKLF